VLGEQTHATTVGRPEAARHVRETFTSNSGQNHRQDSHGPTPGAFHVVAPDAREPSADHHIWVTEGQAAPLIDSFIYYPPGGLEVKPVLPFRVYRVDANL